MTSWGDIDVHGGQCRNDRLRPKDSVRKSLCRNRQAGVQSDSRGRTKAMQRAKCHLFVISARDKPVAVIIRRGPSAWYHIIKWETRRKTHDIFTHGAWFRGRIYPEKCDLSPDGNLFVYFAHQGSRSGTEYTHAYTAVSRAPWLHAVALWPQGTTYGGGGRFLDNYTLTGPTGKQHSSHQSKHICVVPGPCDYHSSSGEVSDADWAGVDFSGRVIFTRNGKVFRRETTRRKSSDVELADFSDLRPDPQPPPGWATRPF